MKTQPIKYPRRLTFLAVTYCDVCEGSETPVNEYINIVKLPQDPFLGWQTCKSEKCLCIINEWKDATTISQETLREIHGDNVIVHRTSGVIEKNWEIFGDAYILSENDTRWITVRKHNSKTTKCLNMDVFVSWQTTA